MRSSDDNLRKMLIAHEGLRLKPYRCTQNKLTIGVGRNLEDVGISEFEAMGMLQADIERVNREAVENFAWFKSLNMPRQDVVLSMIFQMGLKKFKGFKKTIEAIRCGNFDKAADEMKDSDWAKQTPVRAEELIKIMRTGRYA